MRVCRYIDIYHFCISSPCCPVKACEKVKPHGPTVWCACMKEFSNPISRICTISHKFIGLLFVLWPLLSGHDELLQYGAASALHQVSVLRHRMLFIQADGWVIKQMPPGLHFDYVTSLCSGLTVWFTHLFESLKLGLSGKRNSWWCYERFGWWRRLNWDVGVTWIGNWCFSTAMTWHGSCFGYLHFRSGWNLVCGRGTWLAR